MKYFTGRGDEGETSLASGRVPKTDPTVKAMGELDELNSFIGNALAKVGFQHRITSDLKEVEKNIYLINSELSGYMEKVKGKDISPISEKTVKELEETMASYSELVKYVPKFSYPNGTELATTLNICRAIARRAERSVAEIDPKNKNILAYTNRLSSFFYMLFRFANSVGKYEEEFF